MLYLNNWGAGVPVPLSAEEVYTIGYMSGVICENPEGYIAGMAEDILGLDLLKPMAKSNPVRLGKMIAAVVREEMATGLSLEAMRSYLQKLAISATVNGDLGFSQTQVFAWEGFAEAKGKVEVPFVPRLVYDIKTDSFELSFSELSIHIRMADDRLPLVEWEVDNG